MAPDSNPRGFATAVTREPGAAIYLRTVAGLLAALSVLALGVSIYCQLAIYQRPLLTGDMCFDEKAQFISRLRPQRTDIIAAGSSLTLNDLSSDALLREMPAYSTLLN